MGSEREVEAVWTLSGGPLDSEAVVGDLFVAIGELRRVEPAHYDLNRRGKWRVYNGRRLIVDVLTQRTQLVTVIEERGVDDGGTQVVIGTGKQGEPPQALARFQNPWPPSASCATKWRNAVVEAFSDLPLRSFVMRAGSDDDNEPPVVLGATVDEEQKSVIDDRFSDVGRPIGDSTIAGRSFLDADGDVPDRWSELWNRDVS